MMYKVIGVMSGSSLDGLDIVFVHLSEIAGKWSFKIQCAACYEYSDDLTGRLKNAVALPALEYQLLHTLYGHFIGRHIKKFIAENDLDHQVDLVASHGHTTFHLPGQGMTAQLGDGAAIAAETGLPVVSDLRALDVAFGGQGAPLVPIGEDLLFPDFDYLLNLGGIANITSRVRRTGDERSVIAFDVCAANRVLDMLMFETGVKYDEDGREAASGAINSALLEELNNLGYYKQGYPKSLNNDFGTEVVFPLVKSYGLNLADALCTYVEHIAFQVTQFIRSDKIPGVEHQLLITGGGACNNYLVKRLKENLTPINIGVIIPDLDIIHFKEAIIMALVGALRWREEYTVFNSVTGATRKSIGGALWLGTEA